MSLKLSASVQSEIRLDLTQKFPLWLVGLAVPSEWGQSSWTHLSLGK